MTSMRSALLLLGLLLIAPVVPAADSVTVSGELKQWHAVTLTLDGPLANESDTAPNPFTDCAFSVKFTHESGSPSYVVPGYFAADGNAAETSAESGNKWRAHLSPDKTGRWNYTVSFKQGALAALNGGGQPFTPYHGLQGSFTVGETDKSGRDLRAHGRLAYVRQHHLQFQGTGKYFLKVGADAPETLLAYVDFDGTETLNRKAPLKTWGPHVQDWREGDPTWKAGRGKGLIGAINYLSGKGMNVFSFLTYAAGGDGDNVWPFIQRNDKLHYDCSKLDQWGIVFAHGTHQGMYLHFKLSERENSGVIMPDSMAMDGGDLGTERKLYLREMIARYAHHLALNWNLGEENSQSVQQQRDMARYISELDPYHHLIVAHTGGGWGSHESFYPHMVGDQSALTGASLQTRDVMDTHKYVLHWLGASADAGKPWVVANDEQDLGRTGTPPDPDFAGYVQKEGPKTDAIRKYALWATLMAGGAGIEYYFGYVHIENDILCENWRSRDRTWDYARLAHEFFVEQQVPFWETRNANALVGNAANNNSKYCLAKTGELYLVYLPTGGTTSLDLTDAQGDFSVHWYNPRTGGKLLPGTVATVTGGSTVDLGAAPDTTSEDWLIVIRK